MPIITNVGSSLTIRKNLIECVLLFALKASRQRESLLELLRGVFLVPVAHRLDSLRVACERAAVVRSAARRRVVRRSGGEVGRRAGARRVGRLRAVRAQRGEPEKDEGDEGDGACRGAHRPGDGRAFREHAGIDPERPLVLHVGRVAHEKNIGFLVEVFVEVLRSVPTALLVIAGEGPAREALRAQVRALGLERQVQFAGYLERDSALLDCYAAADVFVFASRTETQGLVLLEAMAQGAPVVSTAELGTRSVLVPASGALVVPEERAAFAAAVVRVLSDAQLRRQLAEQGRRYARTWSSAAMAGRLAHIYDELRAAPRAARVVA